jgi:hypothetical protein
MSNGQKVLSFIFVLLVCVLACIVGYRIAVDQPFTNFTADAASATPTTQPTKVPTLVPTAVPTIAPTIVPTQPLTQTETVDPTAMLVETADQGPDGGVLETITQGSWEVTYFKGFTDQMKGWFNALKDPQPTLWPRFPNVDNPDAAFVAADGLEYGLDESVFMEQNEMGNFPVQARGYRLISGDYNIPGIDTCEAAEAEAGCAIAIFNVGEVTADLQAWVRQGFTVPGRYWNGDTLQVAMWALSSHVTANMLNYPTYGAGDDTLNDPNRTNAGANCSVPGACEKVRFVIAITSGNQLLVKAVTIVTR